MVLAQMYLTRSRSVLLLVNDMLGRLHNNSIGLQRDVIDDYTNYCGINNWKTGIALKCRMFL